MRSHVHWAPLLVAVVVGALAWFVAHRSRLNQRLQRREGPLEGFGGWLVFLAAMQWVAVFHTLGDVVLSLNHLKLADSASSNDYARAGSIAALVVRLLLFVFVLSSAIMMHRRSRLFPGLFRVEMVLLVLAPLLVAALVTWETEHAQMSAAIRAVFWIRVAILAPAAGVGYVYSLRSVRFRNTFVR